jgi:hypothetical protein
MTRLLDQDRRRPLARGVVRRPSLAGVVVPAVAANPASAIALAIASL